MQPLLLFDIDGTLIHAKGVGAAAMEHTGRTLFGDAFTFQGVDFAGQLDRLLFQQAADRAGLTFDSPDEHDHHHTRFRDHYTQTLATTLAQPDHPLTPCPGAVQLIDQLRLRRDTQNDIVLGMLTGNYRTSAAVKLAAANIDINWFTIAAFGDEADSRPGLTERCLQRYTQTHNTTPDPQRVIIIGDTPRDIHCAKAHQCTAVAVATGNYSAQQLTDAGADHVLPDLTNPQPLLNLLD